LTNDNGDDCQNRTQDERYLALAKEVSTWSKDPSTQVGAVTVGSKKEVLSQGFNGFPRNIKDTDERYNNRETKYKFVVHAEMNAIYKRLGQLILKLKSPSKNAR
jgi:deoxycytidylate deaminase